MQTNIKNISFAEMSDSDEEAFERYRAQRREEMMRQYDETPFFPIPFFPIPFFLSLLWLIFIILFIARAAAKQMSQKGLQLLKNESDFFESMHCPFCSHAFSYHYTETCHLPLL